MPGAREASEISPLLSEEGIVPTCLDPGEAPDRRPLNNNDSHAGENAKPPDTEAAGSEDVNDARTQQFRGMPEARKQLKILVPAMGIGVFLSAADQTIVASAYGKIGSELQALNNTSWIATSYLLSITAFQPLYGKLSDIFGRKAALLFAYLIFGVGCVFCGLAQTMPQLIAARAFAGIGGGGMTTVVSITMSDMVPLKERGTWQGIINIIYAAGSSSGAPLGGLFADSISWRWAFLGQAPLCLIAFLAVAFSMRLPASNKEHWVARLRRIDFPGALVLIATVTLLLIGLDQGANDAWSSPLVIASLAASVPLCILFVLVETKFAKEAFAPSRIIFDRSLFAAYLCNFFSFGGLFFILYFLPLYYQAVEETSASQAGLSLLPAIIAGVAGSLFGGVVMQKTGKYYWITVGGYCLLTIGTAVEFLCLGILAYSNVGIAVGLVLGGFGNGIGVTSTLIALISNAAPEDQAVTTACSYLFRSLGSTVGLSSLTAVVQYQLKTRLQAELGSGQDVDEIVRRVRESLDYVKTLPLDVQDVVRSAYGVSIRNGFGLAIVFAFLAVFFAFFIREKQLSK